MRDGWVSFNPRAREGRDGKVITYPYDLPCFNPRAREGRDSRGHYCASSSSVSTHAPAKGATCQ